MIKYFSIIFIVIFSKFFLKTKILANECSIDEYIVLRTGESFIDTESCEVCKCDENGVLSCTYHLECENLNCRNAQGDKLICCKKLNCDSHSNSSEHYNGGLSNQNSSWIATGVFLAIFIIVIIIYFIRKLGHTPLRRRRPNPFSEGYVRFTSSRRLQQ